MEGSAIDRSNRGDDRHLAHDEDDNTAALRAEREAHADFARALFGGVGKHAVESDRGKNHGEDGEADGEEGQRALIARRLR